MKVTFNINFHTVWGQKLCVVGSIPELGSWEPALAKEMSYKGDGNWQLELEVTSPVKDIEYRYFLSVNDRQIFEEWEKNHQVFFIGQADQYTLYDYWQVRPANLAFYSSAFTKSLFAHPCNTHERVVKSGKRLTIKISVPRVEKNQRVAITGNQECLGNWHPDKALILSCDTFPVWHIDLDAGEITYPLEYKFLICDDQQQPLYWEEDENRVLNLPPQQVGETAIVSGLYFRDNLPLWRCAGSVIPVFSLRSEKSFGVGDLGDLRILVDWVRKTRQRIIQVLPMNDTTTTHTRTDSYPYSAISIYALHPMYISLPDLGELADSEKAAFFARKQAELNGLDAVDYEQVVRYKLEYCREYFRQEGKAILSTPEYQEFFAQNESWLMPYAAYCYLRDTYRTSDFTQWKENSVFDKNNIRELCSVEGKAYPEISFLYFLQYILHTQFKGVSDYARKNGFKGTFLVEPKPMEPTKHQYDVDTETVIGFLRHYGLDKDFAINIEVNHATLAGHTFEHELQAAADAGMLCSIDANRGDYQNGWDTDQFPVDIYELTQAWLVILEAGGLTTGGTNFDAKTRRNSTDLDDIFLAHISGMDSFARALMAAADILEHSDYKKMRAERYASFDQGDGKKFEEGKLLLEDLRTIALASDEPKQISGKQELYEMIINQYI